MSKLRRIGWKSAVNNTRDPAGREEVLDNEAPPQDEDVFVRRNAWAIGLLSASGFIASVASFLADTSLSDIVTALTGGLATAGVLSTAAAAATVLWRRRSLAGELKALEEVERDIDERVKTAEVRQDIDDPLRAELRTELLKLRESNDARLAALERRMARTGWLQGAVYAALGAAVAILLVVLNHWVPVIK